MTVDVEDAASEIENQGPGISSPCPRVLAWEGREGQELRNRETENTGGLCNVSRGAEMFQVCRYGCRDKGVLTGKNGRWLSVQLFILA
jgi:hypothetical protein